jgi:uncharacterized tellurite resistance protein B-like protein
MHIILAILGAIGVVSVIIWRISIAIEAARIVGDTAQGLANLPRKMRFQSKARREGVEVIADPREAATLLMLSVARAGGEVTASQKATIRGQMTTRFELSEQTADEMLTQVAWLSRELPEPGSAVGRMVGLLKDAVTEDELRQLATMMDLVSHADGDPKPAQRELVEAYRRAAGV